MFLSRSIMICSCNKNKLNQPALGLLDDAALANKNGVDGLLIGAYALLDGVSADGDYKGRWYWRLFFRVYRGFQLDLWKRLRKRSLQGFEVTRSGCDYRNRNFSSSGLQVVQLQVVYLNRNGRLCMPVSQELMQY